MAVVQGNDRLDFTAVDGDSCMFFQSVEPSVDCLARSFDQTAAVEPMLNFVKFGGSLGRSFTPATLFSDRVIGV